MSDEFKNTESLMSLMSAEAIDALIQHFKLRLSDAKASADEPHESLADMEFAKGIERGIENTIEWLLVMLDSKMGKHDYKCLCIYCEATPGSYAYRQDSHLYKNKR